MAGFTQGLGYLSTQRVDLSAPAFGAVTAEQVLAAEQVPEPPFLWVPVRFSIFVANSAPGGLRV